jgi:NADPH:quinone reductase
MIDHLFRQETGKMVSLGESTSVDAFTLINDNLILQGFGLASYFEKPDLMQEAYQYLFSQAATGKLKVHIGQTFALADAAEAHKQMENRKTIGKIALIP